MKIENIEFLTDKQVAELSKNDSILLYVNPFIVKKLKELLEVGIIRPTNVQFMSKKRGCQTSCFKDELVAILDTIGISYELGNDAPRGGKNGNYIKVRKRRLKKYTRKKSVINKIELNRKYLTSGNIERRNLKINELLKN